MTFEEIRQGFLRLPEERRKELLRSANYDLEEYELQKNELKKQTLTKIGLGLFYIILLMYSFFAI